ncbi:hypothetical protein FACS1894198_0980 [Clostridia bacterium]|nr:hypothetical protein FACS1894198_0980 [Clostridia bacterium]
MKKFFAALNFAFLLILSSSLIVSAEVVSDNFENFEGGDADWVQYVNLVPYTHTRLNPDVLNGKKILTRETLSLDNGTVVYRAHGVRTLKVKIFHSSGTFATSKTDNQNQEENKYILGSETDQCRDPFKVYYCKRDDKLYLNHLNKEWRECYFDPVSHYQFKKSDSEFNIENFGKDLVFYGVNVYTSDDNFEFKIVSDCTIESADKVNLFRGDDNNYYLEELSFPIPENVTSIKVVFSNFDYYYFNDGQKQKLSENKQRSSILLAGIDLIGDKIDFDYYGDPGSPVNSKSIKIKEKKPKKIKDHKPAKARVLKEKRDEDEEEEKEEETREGKKFQEVSKATRSDIITVDPEPAFDEITVNVEPEETKPSKEKKVKTPKKTKKHTAHKKRKTAKKVTEKPSLPQNEEKTIFLKTDSNRQKKLPQSNKLLGTSYVLSASGVVLWLVFEDHLKIWASKALSYLLKFKH